MKQERTQLVVLIFRWIARISSLVIAFVFAVFFIGEFDYSTFFSLEILEYVLLAFIPVCYMIGAAIALKHELIGGILMVIAIIGYNIVHLFYQNHSGWDLEFVYLTVPGFIYIIEALISIRYFTNKA